MVDRKVQDDYAEVYERLTDNLDQLETAVEQTIYALRKRGLQLPIDLSAMVQNVQHDFTAIRKNSSSTAGKLYQLQELVRTSTLINSSLDLEQVLADVMDTIVSLAGAERAYLMLRDRDTGELSIRKARNWNQESLPQDEAVFSRGIVNTVLEQGEPILTTNAQADVRFKGMESVFSHALRSIMCIPLLLHGQVTGVMYADNRLGEGNFSQDNIPILTAFANQAATAIENARLFGRVKADLDQAKIEVEKLRVQIDQRHLEKQIGEITETDFFQKLQRDAEAMRRRSNRNSKDSNNTELPE